MAIIKHFYMPITTMFDTHCRRLYKAFPINNAKYNAKKKYSLYTTTQPTQMNRNNKLKEQLNVK